VNFPFFKLKINLLSVNACISVSITTFIPIPEALQASLNFEEISSSTVVLYGFLAIVFSSLPLD